MLSHPSLRLDLRRELSDLPAVPEQDEDSAPIFLFSAGWRSGSTLLQRVICSDPQVMMWGEPFEDRLPLALLHQSLHGLDLDSAHEKYAIENFSGELTSEWIANLNPGLSNYLAAHKAFVDRMLATPARQRGYARWGLKAVRLSGYHAVYLRKLYPDAKIVYLVRDPTDAWLSYGGSRWFGAYPDLVINNVVKFIDHWRFVTQSFLHTRELLDAHLIRYEDFVSSRQAVDRLSEYLELKLDRAIVQVRVGASDNKRKRAISLRSRVERIFAKAMTRKVSAQFARYSSHG